MARKISYLQIPQLIEESMDQHKNLPNPTVEEILETQRQVYEFIAGKVK